MIYIQNSPILSVHGGILTNVYSHVTTTSAKIYFYHPNKFPGTPFQLSPPPSLAPGNVDPLSAHLAFKNSFPSRGGTGKTTEIRFF